MITKNDIIIICVVLFISQLVLIVLALLIYKKCMNRCMNQNMRVSWRFNGSNDIIVNGRE